MFLGVFTALMAMFPASFLVLFGLLISVSMVFLVIHVVGAILKALPFL